MDRLIKAEMNTFKPGDYLASYDKAPACNFKASPRTRFLHPEPTARVERPWVFFTVAPSQDTYGSELLKGDFARMAKKGEMEKMSMKRYQLEAPSEDAGADGFAEAVKNGQAQVQHQSVR